MASQVTTGANRNAPPKKLTQRHYKVIELHLAGQSYVQIGRQLDISRQQVRRVLEHPEAKRRVREQLAEAETRLSNLQNKAIDRLDELLDDEDPRIRLDAISKLAQMSRRAEGDGVNVNVNVGTQQTAREKLLEQLRNTVDVSEYSDVTQGSA